MKIKSITRRNYFDVEMEDGEYEYYRTYGSGDNWEVLMGDSWESCYSKEEELKSMFQNYIQTKMIMIEG
jgi:hypothetical protein